ncbi:coagulation factor XIII B chain-like [Pelodytes ibericus]
MKLETLIILIMHMGICISVKQKSGPESACSITTCDVIQYWPFKRNYKVNDVVQSVCIEGYKLNGFKLSQCYSYGWDPPLPTCEGNRNDSSSHGTDSGSQERTVCPQPPKISNSRKRNSQATYSNGDRVDITCLPRYRLQGSGTIRCENGAWTSPPQCIVENEICKIPPPVLHAEVVRKIVPALGRRSLVEYKCPDNYLLQGNRRIRCENGVWEDPPVCLEPCATRDEDLKANNIELNWWQQSELDVMHNEWIQFQCLSGYKISDIKQLRIQCNRGVLNYPKCTKTEKEGKCSAPPTVRYGDTLEAILPVYNSGSVVEYRCPNFYKLQGNNILKCEDGKWSEPPVCLEPCTVAAKDMKENNIELQYVTAQKLYSEHDDFIEFKCLSQYHISDPKLLRIKCNRGVLRYPKCTKRETCNAPPEVPNGSLKTGKQESYGSGSTVIFQCNADFVAVGSLHVKCDKGQWSDPPQCIQQCRISQQKLNKNNVELVSLDDLNKIYSEGAVVTIRCKPGFRRPFQTFPTAECSDGRMTYTRCFASATCRLNQERIDEHNLELHPIHDNEVYYEDGEEIQFKCKVGFSSQFVTTGRCDDRILTYPKCKEIGSHVTPSALAFLQELSEMA